jgi:hypothetical protein
VDIFICSLDKLVDNLVSKTFSKEALIGADSRSVLLKIMPELTGAGLSVKEIFLPVCRPTPDALILLDNVLCFSICIYSQFYMNIFYFQAFIKTFSL